MEIGVSHGGSLEMWNDYFGGNCTIYGIDINPACQLISQKLGLDNVHVIIADQNDVNAWNKIKESVPKIDIFIDDGGHFMKEQITTYENLYNHISPDGVYLCEDTHTSYWPEYGGGLNNPSTFIEYSKKFIDFLHAYHIHGNTNPESIQFRQSTHSVHFYDSVVVLENDQQ